MSQSSQSGRWRLAPGSTSGGIASHTMASGGREPASGGKEPASGGLRPAPVQISPFVKPTIDHVNTWQWTRKLQGARVNTCAGQWPIEKIIEQVQSHPEILDWHSIEKDLQPEPRAHRR